MHRCVTVHAFPANYIARCGYRKFIWRQAPHKGRCGLGQRPRMDCRDASNKY
jgi:hypothetical protein